MRINNFRHSGVRRLFVADDARGVPSASREKITNMLSFLQSMGRPEELHGFPGWRPHRMKGQAKGVEQWSLRVTGNWRLVFRVDGDEITDVDFIDYH